MNFRRKLIHPNALLEFLDLSLENSSGKNISELVSVSVCVCLCVGVCVYAFFFCACRRECSCKADAENLYTKKI